MISDVQLGFLIGVAITYLAGVAFLGNEETLELLARSCGG